MKYLFVLLFLFSSIQANIINIVATPKCPYACESNAANKGFVVDMISYVFVESGYEVVYTSVNSKEEALIGIKEGRFDVMIGANPQKDKELIYMKMPLGYTYNVIAVPTYSKWKYESAQSLSKLRLAVKQELVYDKEISEYIAFNKDDAAKIQIEAGHLARKHNLKKLRFEKVDAVIDDSVGLRYFYFKTKKPFAFKIAHISKSNAIDIAFTPTSYRSNKYKELLYKGLKRLKGTQKLKEIMKVYGLNESYIRPRFDAY